MLIFAFRFLLLSTVLLLFVCLFAVCLLFVCLLCFHECASVSFRHQGIDPVAGKRKKGHKHRENPKHKTPYFALLVQAGT